MSVAGLERRKYQLRSTVSYCKIYLLIYKKENQFAVATKLYRPLSEALNPLLHIHGLSLIFNKSVNFKY